MRGTTYWFRDEDRGCDNVLCDEVYCKPQGAVVDECTAMVE